MIIMMSVIFRPRSETGDHQEGFSIAMPQHQDAFYWSLEVRLTKSVSAFRTKNVRYASACREL